MARAAGLVSGGGPRLVRGGGGRGRPTGVRGARSSGVALVARPPVLRPQSEHWWTSHQCHPIHSTGNRSGAGLGRSGRRRGLGGDPLGNTFDGPGAADRRRCTLLPPPDPEALPLVGVGALRAGPARDGLSAGDGIALRRRPGLPRGGRLSIDPVAVRGRLRPECRGPGTAVPRATRPMGVGDRDGGAGRLQRNGGAAQRRGPWPASRPRRWSPGRDGTIGQQSAGPRWPGSSAAWQWE